MLSNYDTGSLKYSVQGGDHQTLQMTLNKNHLVRVCQKSIVFLSENVRNLGKDTFYGRMMSSKKDWVILSGINDAFAYIGISSGIGISLFIIFFFLKNFKKKYMKNSVFILRRKIKKHSPKKTESWKYLWNFWKTFFQNKKKYFYL